MMTVGLLMGAGPAHAWYVDISITGAGRVYETTDANELDEHCPAYPEEGFASPSTTPTGALGASCRAGDASGDYGHGWVVRYVAEPAPGYRFAGWQSDGRTAPAPVICDGSGGSSSYTGNACQFATFQNLQTRARFVDDTNPAMSSLTGPAGEVNGPVGFTFSAAADPTLARFECRVAGVHEWLECSSGRQENPATSGTYTFEVRAIDWSGNRSGTSSRQWVVDKISPDTTITGGPSGPLASTSATFTFVGSADAAGYTCTLDGVSSACQSPKSFAGLSQGTHTFSVQARDDAGNLDSTPDSRAWTVDTVAPQTTITDGPAQGSTSSSQSATFTFASTEGGTMECQLDGGGWTDCESPRAYSGLGDGAHTFAVRARDTAGNLDGTPASRAWTVSVPPPPPVTGGEPNVVPLAAMDVRSQFRHRVSRGRTTVRLLKLTKLPADATVKVSCKGRRCAFKSRTLKPSTTYVVLTKLFKNRSLSARTVLKLRITAAGHEPTAFRYKTRNGTKPPIGGEVPRHSIRSTVTPSGFGAV